jgi:hypothetical protein
MATRPCRHSSPPTAPCRVHLDSVLVSGPLNYLRRSPRDVSIATRGSGLLSPLSHVDVVTPAASPLAWIDLCCVRRRGSLQSGRSSVSLQGGSGRTLPFAVGGPPQMAAFGRFNRRWESSQSVPERSSRRTKSRPRCGRSIGSRIGALASHRHRNVPAVRRPPEAVRRPRHGPRRNVVAVVDLLRRLASVGVAVLHVAFPGDDVENRSEAHYANRSDGRRCRRGGCDLW